MLQAGSTPGYQATQQRHSAHDRHQRHRGVYERERGPDREHAMTHWSNNCEQSVPRMDLVASIPPQTSMIIQSTSTDRAVLTQLDAASAECRRPGRRASAMRFVDVNSVLTTADDRWHHRRKRGTPDCAEISGGTCCACADAATITPLVQPAGREHRRAVTRLRKTRVRPFFGGRCRCLRVRRRFVRLAEWNIHQPFCKADGA